MDLVNQTSISEIQFNLSFVRNIPQKFDVFVFFFFEDVTLEFFSCNFSQAMESVLYWTYVINWRVTLCPIPTCLCKIDSFHFKNIW